jgi:8-oxo-dGTP diphosphatase
MAVVTHPPDSWTGADAARLQSALRLSNDDFAHQLGVAPRTVATWHAQPARRPRPEMQRALDTALDLAPLEAKARFGPSSPSAGQAPAGLHVAIAIVIRQGHVLLVQRRDGDLLSWQFPAGVVKPEKSAERVAIQETKTETGIDAAVSREIGARIHPVTGVYCVYFLCDYLAGEAANQDIVENASVTWAPIQAVPRFIPLANIFPPVLEALGVKR